jgi:hypothetical protein
MATLEELEAELRSRGETVSTGSVMYENEPTRGEFSKFAESLTKGSAKGIASVLGGWGNLYDYLKKSKDPNRFSTAGIAKGLKDKTGIDILTIPGYRGAYEFGETGAPAAAFTAAGVPGLFRRTVPGVVAEGTVAGATGLISRSVAPDSPLAQLGIQMLPYGSKLGVKVAEQRITRPEGTFPSPAEIDQLLRVGRLTPGEATLLRQQLATEARVEASPESGAIPFRRAQARDVEGFLTKLFDRAAGKTLTPGETTIAVVDSFKNYGKSLSSQLRSDASKDFNAAKRAGGSVDTSPVIAAIDAQLASLPPEVAGLSSLRGALQRIRDEYVTPATPQTVTPSSITSVSGQPIATTVTPGTPAINTSIDIGRLQKNLAAWGDAAYSGAADFGKGNIFDGVAPGQAKGIALSVLKGFRQSLDDAITNGVPGADKLKTARDNFSKNIQQIEDFSNRPLTKAFDVQNVSELVPENVMQKLKTLPDSQRNILINVMSSHPNPQVTEVLNTIRRSQLEDVLSAGRRGSSSASALEPEFAIDKTLAAMNKKGDLAQLFPNPKDLGDARLAMQWMKRVLTKESASAPGGVGGGAVFGGARTAGLGYGESVVLREAAALLRNVIASPEAFSNIIFSPENRKVLMDLSTKKTLTQKGLDSLYNITKVGAIGAVRAGPMMDTTRPEMRSLPTQESVAGPTLEELEAELKAREAE